jgi:DNA processing protein
MYQPNTLVLLHLSLISELGPASITRLLQFVCHKGPHKNLAPTLADLCASGASFAGVYDLTLQEMLAITGFKKENAQAVVDGLKSKVLLNQELDLLIKHQVALVSLMDQAYPHALKHITHPPVVLYVQGDLGSPDAKGFAIVGSRKATAYAQKIIQAIVPPMVQQGWTMVSGGAQGADTMAHKAAFAAGGRTIAVLGGGLLEPFPLSNVGLFKQIAEQAGAVISPFPLRRTPDRTTFPMRNRIISGLSMGSLVVQAAKQSGALITARFALEQGRSVLAVPGDIHDPLSAGCHSLLKQGARLVTSVDDIFEEFGQVVTQQSLFEGLPAEKLETQPVEQDVLLATLQQPVTLDELQFKTALTIEELQDRLFVLQVEGRVKQHFSGTWQHI